MKYNYLQFVISTFGRICKVVLFVGVMFSLTACGKQGSEVATLIQTVQLSKPPMQAIWHPDSKRFAVDGFGDLAIWEFPSMKQIAAPSFWVASPSAAYSPDGRILALHKVVGTPTTRHSLVLVDAQNHHVIRELEDMYPIEYGGGFSPDSRFLVVMGHKKATHIATVLDVATGAIVAELETLHDDPTSKGNNFIQRVVYSPDNSTVMIGFITGKIDVWSTKDWHLIKTFKAHKGYVKSMAVSPNGKWLVTGSNSSGGTGWRYDPITQTRTETQYDDPIKIWDTTTWQQIGEFPINNKYTSSLAFLPNGKYLLSANEEQVVFWNVQSKKRVGEVGTFKGKGALNFALSQDGEYLAVVGIGTKEAQVWKIATQFNN